MGTLYSQLSLRERILTDLLRAEGLSNRKIAARLGRSPSTVGRELERNTRPSNRRRLSYDGAYAHRRAARRRHDDCRLKMVRQPDLQEHVRQGLAMGQSPEQICGRLARENSTMRISHESIYRFVYRRQARRDDGWRAMLPQNRRKRGRRLKGGWTAVKSFPAYVSIDERPAEIGARQTPGHWEADLMAFRQNSQFNLVIHERMSRKSFLNRQPDKTALAVRKRLTSTLRKVPEIMRRSLTYDNGPEFALHHKINASLGTQSYFCHIRSPWEKGGVENAIGRLRRWLPRHTDIKAMSHQALAKIVDAYNNTPRKCLGYLTPNEAFDNLLKGQTVALQT